MKKAVIIIVVLIIIGVGGFWVLSSRNKTSDTTNSTTPPASQETAKSETTDSTNSDCGKVTGAQATITYTASRTFSPSCIQIAKGTKIVWKNDSQSMVEVGVNPHPSHTGDRAVTNGEFTLDIAAGGQSETTSMDKAGTFGYHNHLNAASTGQVIVE